MKQQASAGTVAVLVSIKTSVKAVSKSRDGVAPDSKPLLIVELLSLAIL